MLIKSCFKMRDDLLYVLFYFHNLLPSDSDKNDRWIRYKASGLFLRNVWKGMILMLNTVHCDVQ